MATGIVVLNGPGYSATSQRLPLCSSRFGTQVTNLEHLKTLRPNGIIRLDPAVARSKIRGRSTGNRAAASHRCWFRHHGRRAGRGNDAVALLGNTIATGAILFVLITVLGPISGAHFNPAVTLAFTLRGEISIRDAVLYVVVQIIAGFIGVVIAHLMFDLTLIQESTTVRTGMGND